MIAARQLLLIACLVLASSAAQAGSTCTCRANGQKYEQGQILCILGRLSRCEMNLNNPSWKVIAGSCPETRLLPSQQYLLARLGQILPLSRPAHDLHAMR